MNKIFNFLLAVILVACSQKKPSLIPQQNSAELTQIYILMGEDASCEFPFVSMLNVEEIQNELNARVIVQREKVPSIAKLREINARNPQLIILGPGWPQEYWFKDAPSAYPNRKVVFLAAGEKTKLLAEQSMVQVDWAELSDFYRKACVVVGSKSCGFYPPQCGGKVSWKKNEDSRRDLISIDNDHASIYKLRLLWPTLLRDLISQSKSQKIVLNVKSAYLQIQLSSGDLKNSNADEAKLLKLWLMERL